MVKQVTQVKIGSSMSPSKSPVRWLSELLEDVEGLPTPREPRPYYSQRIGEAGPHSTASIESTSRRVNAVVRDLEKKHFFANVIGYDCFDGNGDATSTIPLELEQRVNKAHLWEGRIGEWSEDDLCDFTEVFFDLVARPAKEVFHSYMGCGWHPTSFSTASGQSIYLWRVNSIYDSSHIGLRLADSGEDRGRMVHTQSAEMESLIAETTTTSSSASEEIVHAVALFRRRNATLPEKRSAVVSLAGILESRRSLIRSTQLSVAEDSLFNIANRFGLRHRRADQMTDYNEAFLDWIFYWYLATVNLTERLDTPPTGL